MRVSSLASRTRRATPASSSAIAIALAMASTVTFALAVLWILADMRV